MKPLQQYFHMVLFIWYIVLTFESVDEIPSCYHSNETSLVEFLQSTILFMYFCILVTIWSEKVINSF